MHNLRKGLVTLLLLSAPVLADDGWIIGQFDDRATAVREGERVSGAVGIEVLMRPAATSGYELLVQPFSDEQDQMRLRSQLQYAGISNLTETTLDVTDPQLRSLFAVMDFPSDDTSGLAASVASTRPAAELARGDFLVVASFASETAATAVASDMASRYSTRVMPHSLPDKTVYRVLVGPVTDDDADYQRTLLAGDAMTSWLWRDVSYEVDIATSAETEPTSSADTPATVSSASASDGLYEPGPERDVSRTRRSSQPVQVPGADDQYNPAALRDESYQFKRPRR